MSKVLMKTIFAFIAILKAVTCTHSSTTSAVDGPKHPLLMQVAQGQNVENIERTPIWMMRQAGRHMKVYRNLVEKYPTFRERSETPDVSFKISLQPYEAYAVDGVILFSDILTPLPAMGIDFSISESGKISIEPLENEEDLAKLKQINSDQFEILCPFVGEVLTKLRKEVPSTATVLGFVGLPFTLASYLVEGQTGVSTGFQRIHTMKETNPGLLHRLLTRLAYNIAQYAIYQINCGAQVLQVFDSWAGYMNDEDYDMFCAPYQKQVIEIIKHQHPGTPIIIYMAPGKYSKHGRRLSRLVKTGADVISVDHTVDMSVARSIIPESIGLQGNLDPQVLRDGPLEEIIIQTKAILNKAAGRRHIMNLGHGIDPATPEEHAALFIKTVQEYRQKSNIQENN